MTATMTMTTTAASTTAIKWQSVNNVYLRYKKKWRNCQRRENWFVICAQHIEHVLRKEKNFKSLTCFNWYPLWRHHQQAQREPGACCVCDRARLIKANAIDEHKRQCTKMNEILNPERRHKMNSRRPGNCLSATLKWKWRRPKNRPNHVDFSGTRWVDANLCWRKRDTKVSFRYIPCHWQWFQMNR